MDATLCRGFGEGCLCVFVCVCDGEGVCAVTFTEEAL